MANWYGTARSNYFAVKDLDAFKAWADLNDLEILEETEAGVKTGKVGLTPADNDSGGWPSYRYNEENDEEIEINLAKELPIYLAEGEVAVLMEVGNEKLRYVTGNSWAVHSSGKVVQVDIGEIYRKAAKKFKVPINSISLATY